MQDNINFQFQAYQGNFLIPLEKLKSWLLAVAQTEEKVIGNLHYIFCDDDFLLAMNQQYLQHDTWTDVITFPDSYQPICAEIYISMDRVRENALEHSEGRVLVELARVMVHGFLHMCGYEDHTKEDKDRMRAREGYHLSNLHI